MMTNKAATLTMNPSEFEQPHHYLTYKAIIACFEAIPCDPCVTYCPVHAITIEPSLHAQPHLDIDACTGCAICVAVCPGLAIMCAKISDAKATFKIPYELNTTFEKGMVVTALNRYGEAIGTAKVLSVRQHRSTLTTILEVEVDLSLLQEFSTIKEVAHG